MAYRSAIAKLLHGDRGMIHCPLALADTAVFSETIDRRVWCVRVEGHNIGHIHADPVDISAAYRSMVFDGRGITLTVFYKASNVRNSIVDSLDETVGDSLRHLDFIIAASVLEEDGQERWFHIDALLLQWTVGHVVRGHLDRECMSDTECLRVFARLVIGAILEVVKKP